MLILTQLSHRQEAQALADILRARGISSRLGDSGEVAVEPDDFEAAFAVLAEAELVPASPWTGEACPTCASHQVRDCGVDWKHASWAFLLLTVALVGLPLLWRRRVHRCQVCGEGW